MYLELNIPNLVENPKNQKQAVVVKLVYFINLSSCGIDQLPSQPSAREHLKFYNEPFIIHLITPDYISSFNEKYVYVTKFIFGFSQTISHPSSDFVIEFMS